MRRSCRKEWGGGNWGWGFRLLRVHWLDRRDGEGFGGMVEEEEVWDRPLLLLRTLFAKQRIEYPRKKSMDGRTQRVRPSILIPGSCGVWVGNWNS